MSSKTKICIGMIAGPHGVRGLVRLRSFTEDPEDIVAYGPLTDETGKRRFDITIQNAMNDHYVASIKGVDNREDAEELHGMRLYVDRATLPKTSKTEFYAADLVGLAAHDAAGKDYGTVLDVHDHGAGTFLEIGKTRKDSFMLPFSDAFVPEMDATARKVTIAPPEGWLADEKPPAEPRPEGTKAGKKSRKAGAK